MILMAGNDVEALLERRIEALEAGAVDDVARSARGKRADGGGLKYTRIKPLSAGGRAKLVRQGRRARVHVVLIARTRSDAGLVEVSRNRS